MYVSTRWNERGVMYKSWVSDNYRCKSEQQEVTGKICQEEKLLVIKNLTGFTYRNRKLNG